MNYEFATLNSLRVNQYVKERLFYRQGVHPAFTFPKNLLRLSWNFMHYQADKFAVTATAFGQIGNG